ncbi:MAG: glycosyltransferase [Candidatus Nitronauta litoralis]|uniref:Glycosyltransferase n=1 Tax=Candidatus Nitronauta litoralis TaxID=2705533 RepID=A0A7T0BXT9_9BACT|nr:MAG: glycosyltransferase [Candidatus Nitronauta litoralis]
MPDTYINTPRVSVVIPTYNRVEFLEKAVESVLLQTWSNWELIVVDDGSTDDTADTMQGIPQVNFLRFEENKGVSYARNRGIEIAGGEFICFLDSDDQWLPEKLTRQVQWMEKNPECSACYTDEIWIRNGVRVNPMKKHRKYSGQVFRNCLPLCIISPSSIMMRRELFNDIGVFDESLPACEDYDLWLRLTLRNPVHFIDEKLIVKTGGHSDQLSRKYWGMDRFRVYAMEKVMKNPGISPEQKMWVLEMLIEKCRILSYGYNNNNKPADASLFFEKAENYAAELTTIPGKSEEGFQKKI